QATRFLGKPSRPFRGHAVSPGRCGKGLSSRPQRPPQARAPGTSPTRVAGVRCCARGRPRTGALRLVPAAPACEMFRLTGRKPAATLNTYPARAWCFDILNPLWSHFSLPFPDTLSHTLSGLTEFESNVRFMDEVVFARALS